MNVLAIDPGYEVSGWVLFDGEKVVEHGIEPNDALLSRLTSSTWRVGEITNVVIEMIESFGMAVGRETFETVFFIGRLYECARYRTNWVERMTRRTAKLHICEFNRATDSSVRQALIDRFGGSERAIGRKASPGVLYGVKSHEFAALALAVTWWDRKLSIAQMEMT